jgi:hypothetical protein
LGSTMLHAIYYIQKGFLELYVHDRAWMVVHARSA